jgi:hypothetical protein
LETATVLPVGAIVTLEPLEDSILPAPGGDSAFLPAAADASFEEAINVLRQSAPQAILPPPSSAPDFSSQLAAALIGLTAAVDSASVRPWLGDKQVKLLEKAGQRGLIESMEKDLATLKTPVRMPLSGEWLSFVLPLPLGHSIERIRLVVRRPKGDDTEKNAPEDKGIRFLLDVTMSRLGALQIDGLVQRKSKRFDMILRSHDALPDGMRRDVAAIFARSLEGLGMIGSASFQRTPTFIAPIPITKSEISGWVI